MLQIYDVKGVSGKEMPAASQNETRMANNITSLFSVKSFTVSQEHST
jgi:hypothetical protein